MAGQPMSTASPGKVRCWLVTASAPQVHTGPNWRAQVIGRVGRGYYLFGSRLDGGAFPFDDTDYPTTRRDMDRNREVWVEVEWKRRTGYLWIGFLREVSQDELNEA